MFSFPDSVFARARVESDMTHITGFEPSPLLLLPEAIDDYVGVDNPVRFIDAFKQWMNQGAFLMRSVDKIRAEFSLMALVYNLRRALNILGVEKLMEAVAA